jgi:hypothetical protein
MAAHFTFPLTIFLGSVQRFGFVPHPPAFSFFSPQKNGIVFDISPLGERVGT